MCSSLSGVLSYLQEVSGCRRFTQTSNARGFPVSLQECDHGQMKSQQQNWGCPFFEGAQLFGGFKRDPLLFLLFFFFFGGESPRKQLHLFWRLRDVPSPFASERSEGPVLLQFGCGMKGPVGLRKFPFFSTIVLFNNRICFPGFLRVC